MDAAPIKQMLEQIVPFVKTVGLSIDDVQPGRAVATLGNDEPVQNHLGTVHAGALYTLGESATGAVVLGMFMDLLPGGAFIALKSAAVTHTKARAGDLTATATLAGDAEPAALATRIRQAFEADGKADFPVDVSFTVDGTEVAQVRYTWAARTPR
jgi:acyl-coenzyme A thioesterase PaaI-like protein